MVAQCTTGSLASYGAKYDYDYVDNASWNVRRKSITAGDGTAKVSTGHWLIDALAGAVEFSDAGAGYKAVPYALIDYIHYGGAAQYSKTSSHRNWVSAASQSISKSAPGNRSLSQSQFLFTTEKLG